MSDLKTKTLTAISWSFVETVISQGIRFVIGIVLARLLFPEQFGLIGMLTIFIAVAQTFLDSGFGYALIQKREASETDICSIFYFNILIGFVAAILLSLAAPWIAEFYHQPELTSLTRFLSLIMVINSFGMIQSTLLTKKIDFKTQAKISLISGVLSGITGISLAASGFGVWSLAIQQVGGTLVGTVVLWLYSPWRPSLLFSLESLREMFGFGSRMLFSAVLNQVFDNIYSLVIGKLFTPSDLGFFTRAKNLNDLPSRTLSTMVGRVAFPVFSEIQNDPERIKRGLKKGMMTLALVNFPLMIGIAVVARPLVAALLTEKWLPCVLYLQLLSIIGLLYPMQLMNLNVLQALGRSDLFLRLEIIKKILIIVNIAVAWRWGITALIYGMVVNSFLSYYLNTYYIGVYIKYSIWEQVHDLLSYLTVAILMGAVVYAVGAFHYATYWTMLLVQIPVGITIYLCLCRLFRLSEFMEAWQSAWDRMRLLRAGTVG